MIFRMWLIFLMLITLSVSCLLDPAGAQDTAINELPNVGSEPVIPPSTFRAEFLEELAFCERRFLLLAEAMPAEKYSWRPAQGMRSVGGLFAHVVIANYNAVVALDQEQDPQSGPQSSLQPETILAIAEDKPKIMEALKNSFGYLRARILNLSDGDGDKAQRMFNRQTTLRGALMIIDRHLGQHLGQATTYALINGVVPPWKQKSQQE